MKISLYIVFVVAILTVFCANNQAQDKQQIDSLHFRLESAPDDSSKVTLLTQISASYFSMDLPLSFQYAEKAVKMAEESKKKNLLALAYMNAGNICFMQGLFEMAVKHYYAAMNIHKETGNPEGVAQSLTNLGAIQLQLHKFEESKKYFNEALQVFSEVAQKRGDTIPPPAVVSIYNNLGIAFENMQDYNQAIDYYNRGISLEKRIAGQSKNMAMLYNNLGSSYMKRGNPAEAIENMEQALKIRKASFDKTGEAASYRMMGIFYFSQKEYIHALENCYMGLKLATEVGSTPIISGISEHLFEVYNELNKPDSALKYHILFKKYADQLKNEETLREFTRMEIVSQYQEKEKIQQVERRRQALRHLLIAIVLVFLVVILGLLYFLSQGRLRRLNLMNRNIQLASEKAGLEREALSRELELKNKELTTNVMYQIRKNELIHSIAGKLMSNRHNFKKENQKLIKEIIHELEDSQEDTVWKEFESRFHQVHNQFYDQLNAINPDLSPNERRLCAFLRLNMSSKEISSITGQSLRSIEVARTRLRRKLNLTNSEVGLIEYLATL